MTRAVVSVATTEHTRRGQKRLKMAGHDFAAKAVPLLWNCLPPFCPSHEDVPYAFKAYALQQAANQKYDLLLWCDASILPVRSLEPLWQRIEQEGAVIVNNGWSNGTWTSDSAYPNLFPEMWNQREASTTLVWEKMRATNREIPHVVAGFFGLNVRHPKGAAILAEYYRLASETRAFCGPHWNSNHPDNADKPPSMTGPCGPPDVKGHRHDQAILSVLAWRNGVKLTNPPEVLVYPPAGWSTSEPLKGIDEKTIVIADGSYA